MEKMEFSLKAACLLCSLLLICVERVVCIPIMKDERNSTKIYLMSQNSTLHGSNKNTNESNKKILTIEDLPDDGSLDEVFERLHPNFGMYHLFRYPFSKYMTCFDRGL